MKQYILSLYTDVDPVSNLLSVSLRHDHNMSLWVKENDKITLLRHWEFERFTGLKQHSVSFFSINLSLSRFLISSSTFSLFVFTLFGRSL